jgi:hypothetical protein
LLDTVQQIQQNSRWYQRLGVLLKLHGDSAFALESPVLTYGSELGFVRISEEWSYAGLKVLFPSTQFRRLLQIKKAPVTKMLMVALLLKNAFVCLNHGSEISDYYGCYPPTLEQYTSRGIIANVFEMNGLGEDDDDDQNGDGEEIQV